MSEHPSCSSLALSRRTFIKLAATTSGLTFSGLSHAFSGVATNSEEHITDSAEFKLLTIHSDNSITVYNSRSEMGQGCMTSLTQMLFEDLDADWQQIREVKLAWADQEKFGHQNTIGAISSLIGWMNHRQAGGKINLLLRQSAAKVWQVPLEQVSTEKGRLINKLTEQFLTFGQLARLVQGKPLVDKVELKSAENYHTIGKSKPRLDLPEKITGKAKFGIDQHRPGLKTALVARCPVFGGMVKTYDDDKAKLIKGVQQIVQVPSGVAIIADNYWQAQQAKKLLVITWDYGDFSKQSSDKFHRQFKDQLTTTGKKIADKGNVQLVLNNGKQVSEGIELSTDYQFALVGHMTMEPMNCTVELQGDECSIWAPTQNPQDAKKSAAKTLGFEDKNVKVNVTYMGGGFGRRAQDDFIIEACEVAKRCQFPVKVVWTREDDLQHDYYRPLNNQQINACISKGKITGWQHKVATLSTSPYHFSLEDRDKDAGDWVAYGGSESSLYQIENFQTQLHLTKSPMPVGILRGISHGYINFAIESTIDQLALAANIAPITFRQNHIIEARALKVLSLLEEKVHTLTLKKDQFIGVAFGHEKATQGPYQYYNAAIAIVRKTPSEVIIDKVMLVLDHGQVINPDGLLAQAQGSVIFALGIMFGDKLELKEGRIAQSNFHDYSVPRLSQSVDVEVTTTGNHDWSMGVGEKLQGTIQPAIANAIFAATGKRITSLPVDLSEIASEAIKKQNSVQNNNHNEEVENA